MNAANKESIIAKIIQQKLADMNAGSCRPPCTGVCGATVKSE